jgi:Ca2+-binding EF-hand superfamily protein
LRGAGKSVPGNLFAWFDRDGSGKVDRQEFRAEMKEVMLEVANVDRELGQLAKAA